MTTKAHTQGTLEASTLRTNDGSVPLIIQGPNGLDDRKRLGLVDCQSEFKRGQGWKHECAERDANVARLIVAWNSHDDLVAALKAVLHAHGLVGAARAAAHDKLFGSDGKVHAALAKAQP
jgi:hypothetical protein